MWWYDMCIYGCLETMCQHKWMRQFKAWQNVEMVLDLLLCAEGRHLSTYMLSHFIVAGWLFAEQMFCRCKVLLYDYVALSLAWMCCCGFVRWSLLDVSTVVCCVVDWHQCWLSNDTTQERIPTQKTNKSRYLKSNRNGNISTHTHQHKLMLRRKIQTNRLKLHKKETRRKQTATFHNIDSFWLLWEKHFVVVEYSYCESFEKANEK